VPRGYAKASIAFKENHKRAAEQRYVVTEVETWQPATRGKVMVLGLGLICLCASDEKRRKGKSLREFKKGAPQNIFLEE